MIYAKTGPPTFDSKVWNLKVEQTDKVPLVISLNDRIALLQMPMY